MRRTASRARRVNGTRRQRSPLVTSSTISHETPPDGSAYELDESADDLEKIEVHVHVHRGDLEAKARRKRPAPPLVLTGALFDWKEHYEEFCKLPAPPRPKGTAFRPMCDVCGLRVGLFARSCGECQAFQPRYALSKLIVAIGVASVIGVFALCAHLLGDSVPEHKAPEAQREWTEDPPEVVEVPTAPSPFSYDPHGAQHTTISTDRTMTR